VRGERLPDDERNGEDFVVRLLYVYNWHLCFNFDHFVQILIYFHGSHCVFTRPTAAGGSGLYSELSMSLSFSQSVPRENYMIEWSDQKVHEQKVAIFFYCDAKKSKKNVKRWISHCFTDFTGCGMLMSDFVY
jgi:hypothetical protein